MSFRSGRGAVSRAVVALVTVVLLAGCSFLPFGAGPTATPNESTSPADSYPAGYDADGVVDADAALDAHAETLLSARSFYLEYNGSAVSGNRTAGVYSAQVVNRSDDRAYVVSVVQGTGSTVQYFSDDRRYVRRNPPGESGPNYDSENASVEPDEFTGRGLYGPLLRNIEWENATRTDENGTQVQYTADSLTAVGPVLGDSVDAGNVSGFQASMVVSRDGVVREVVYGATIEREETSEVGISVTTLQVGNTTVEEPAWLDRARSS